MRAMLERMFVVAERVCVRERKWFSKNSHTTTRGENNIDTIGMAKREMKIMEFVNGRELNWRPRCFIFIFANSCRWAHAHTRNTGAFMQNILNLQRSSLLGRVFRSHLMANF